MLWDLNFTYDSSMPIYENRPPSWPYTLDYKLFHDCMIPPCPTRSYPGLWEVPMVMWQDLNGGRCSMGDACSNPPTSDGVYKMLIKNFERHYTTNRLVNLSYLRWDCRLAIIIYSNSTLRRLLLRIHEKSFYMHLLYFNLSFKLQFPFQLLYFSHIRLNIYVRVYYLYICICIRILYVLHFNKVEKYYIFGKSQIQRFPKLK